MNIVMGFSCTGGEMERLVVLVPFFKGGKRGNNKCKESPSFVIVLLYGKVWCIA